jgi:hypothetical protein
MQIRSVVEVLTAGHLAHLVNCPREFSARGGMMFVAPVGHLKTAITKTLDAWKPAACVMSDVTIRELSDMREEIATGKVTTLGFMELPKIYARNKDVASNVEGAIQQMVDEGFRTPNWLPQNMTVKEAKAFVVGAMPPIFYQRHWGDWTHGGWARRFLWCHFQLGNPELIMDAIDKWQPLQFGKLVYSIPAAGAIPFDCTEADSAFIRGILRQTKAGYEAVPYVLMKKIISVLKWRYDDLGAKTASSKAIEILADFSECLQGVADLQIDLHLIGNHEPVQTIETRKPAKRANKRA